MVENPLEHSEGGTPKQTTFDRLRTLFMNPSNKVGVYEGGGLTFAELQGRDPETNERIVVENSMIRPHIRSELVPRYVLRIVDKNGYFRKSYDVEETEVKVIGGFESDDMHMPLSGKDLDPLHDLIGRIEFDQT